MSIRNYLNGETHGEYKLFHKSSKLQIQGMYNNGNPSGKWIEYDEQDKVIKLTQYDKNGIEILEYPKD